jgi:hypothetical protein
VGINFDPVDTNLSSFGSFTEVVPIGPDLSFSTRAFAVRMKVAVSGLPEGWALKAVRRAGIDVTDEGVDLSQGSAVRDLEVQLTNRLTELTGTARTSNGETADDYTVVVFARDPARRNGDRRYFGSARPDQNRAFSIRGLAAGDYLIAVLEYAAVNIMEDPLFLESLARSATAVTLPDEGSIAVDLRVVRP